MSQTTWIFTNTDMRTSNFAIGGLTNPIQGWGKWQETPSMSVESERCNDLRTCVLKDPAWNWSHKRVLTWITDRGKPSEKHFFVNWGVSERLLEAVCLFVCLFVSELSWYSFGMWCCSVKNGMTTFFWIVECHRICICFINKVCRNCQPFRPTTCTLYSFQLYCPLHVVNKHVMIGMC
jgi:hypothetical protein